MQNDILVLLFFQLAEHNALELWKQALSTGWVVQLWRDEVLHIHGYIEKYFERIKGRWILCTEVV